MHSIVSTAIPSTGCPLRFGSSGFAALRSSFGGIFTWSPRTFTETTLVVARSNSRHPVLNSKLSTTNIGGAFGLTSGFVGPAR